MKFSAIIVDDEPLAIDLVKNYLAHFPEIEVNATCQNGFEALKVIQETKPDLLFLDVQMPKINGFELLELIEDPPQIIFTTAYDQYAVKAFDQNAVDYLLKPFSESRFQEAVQKALSILKSQDTNTSYLNHLKKSIQEDHDILDRIVVRTGSKIKIIPSTEIIYLEAQDDYVSIVTPEGKYLKQQTMKYYQTHLDPENFVRIHRSFIVQLAEIKQVELMGKSSHVLILSNGQRLPVSKSGYQQLKEILHF